jgi:hypothetical protein
MGKKSGSGILIRDEQPGSYFRELRNNFFGFKYLSSLTRIRNPGWKNSEWGWKKFGSGIRNKHPGSATLLNSYILSQRQQFVQEYKANPKKAHDGTIEYLSRDAHIGRWLVRLSFCFLLFPTLKNKTISLQTFFHFYNKKLFHLNLLIAYAFLFPYKILSFSSLK